MDARHDPNATHEWNDTRPLCWVCGEPMDETGDYREIGLDGGFAGIIEEPIYACYNPECWDDDDDYR